MKKVENDAEFKRLSLLEEAMIFIFFEWSATSHLAKRVLLNWESKSKLKIPLFEIEPDESKLISKWVYEQVKERGGNGSLVWLKSGTILGIEYNIKNFASPELEEKTAKLFGQ